MKKLSEYSRQELENQKKELETQYKEACNRGLSLDMSRGKPAAKQLELSMGLLDAVNAKDSAMTDNGTDCRNYGVLDGIPEAKKLMADIMGTSPEHVVVGGNSSLNMMFDTVSRGMFQGFGGCKPWKDQGEVIFLCPVPGYDRHFSVTEYFGIKMVNIPMTEDGPDMDMVEQYVTNPQVKGMWNIPKYSNPTGYTYSDDTVRRMANLKPAAKDFRIFWDNAYVVHHLYEDDQDELLDIIAECEKSGHPDMVFEFASTSKVSFPGGGIAAFASSVKNVEEMKKCLTIMTIGYDKINQLRHVRYFKDISGVKKHMMDQADIMRPKFEAVLKVFKEELGGLHIGTWTKPKGGYFISFETMEGCAKAVVAKCKEAGVVLTGAGAPFPYKKDPKDTNIRIAPSFPTPEELQMTAELFVLCVKLVSIDKILQEKK